MAGFNSQCVETSCRGIGIYLDTGVTYRDNEILGRFLGRNGFVHKCLSRSTSSNTLSDDIFYKRVWIISGPFLFVPDIYRKIKIYYGRT